MPDSFSAWLWWVFTTIILALVINIISAYFKPAIDKQLGKWFTARRLENEKYQAYIEQRARSILQYNELYTDAVGRKFTYLIIATTASFFFLATLVALAISLSAASYSSSGKIFIPKPTFWLFVGSTFLLGWMSATIRRGLLVHNGESRVLERYEELRKSLNAQGNDSLLQASDKPEIETSSGGQ